MHWRHERLSVAMALADALHHSDQPRAKPGEAEQYDAPWRQMNLPDREAEFYVMSESSVVLGGQPPPLEEARPQGSIARHGVNTETLVLDVPMLLMIDEDLPFDAFLEPWAEQKSRERREARMERRNRRKRRKKKLPKAASGHGRSCDHAAPVPAVFAAREREGASDSVHRHTLELPAAPQRQVRIVQTVQVFGDSTLQFLGEVDGPVAMTGAGDGLDSAERGGSTAAAPGQVRGLARCCARQGLSSDSAGTVSPVLFSDKDADMPVFVVQTVQTQFLDKVIDVPVLCTTGAYGGSDRAVLDKC